MNDPMETTIREALRGRPAPRVSADFVSAVMERVERRKPRPRSVWDELVVMAAYWSGVLVVSTLFLAETAMPGTSRVWLAILTPALFMAPLASGPLKRLASRPD
jgi:hypothetical protein